MNTWVKVGLPGVVIILAVVLVILGARAVDRWPQDKAGGVIRGNCFVLEDEEGRERARLEMRNGGPRLVLLDENGTDRIKLFYMLNSFA
jgi:hypothetical protein